MLKKHVLLRVNLVTQFLKILQLRLLLTGNKLTMYEQNYNTDSYLGNYFY